MTYYLDGTEVVDRPEVRNRARAWGMEPHEYIARFRLEPYRRKAKPVPSAPSDYRQAALIIDPELNGWTRGHA